jgi:HlyD family secretion protein
VAQFPDIVIAPVGGSYLLLCAAQLESRTPRTDPELARRSALGDERVLDVIAPERAPDRSTLRRWLLRALLALGSLLALAVGLAAAGSVTRGKPAGYELRPVQHRSFQAVVAATGLLQPESRIDIGAEVTGRVVEVRVQENDVVAAGQTLATIDAEQQEATVARNRAQVASAVAGIDLAKVELAEVVSTLARTRALAKGAVASRSALEAAEASEARARARLAQSRAAARAARASLAESVSLLDKSTIASPIDGIVLGRMVEPGQTVTAGFQTPVLFTIAGDLRRLEMIVDVDEADVGRVHEGQRASFQVEAYPGRTFPAEVVRMSRRSRTSGNVVV